MLELEIRERPPLMLINIDGGPLGGGARDLGVSTINATKRRRRAHWEVLKLVIWERPPTTLINVDGGAPGRQ
jgi:hypothetical protein